MLFNMQLIWVKFSYVIKKKKKKKLASHQSKERKIKLALIL